MKEETKPTMPELSKEFLENLEEIAGGLNGRPITSDFCSEWKVGAANTNLLLEYMLKTGIIEVVWNAMLQEFCYVKATYIKN